MTYESFAPRKCPKSLRSTLTFLCRIGSLKAVQRTIIVTEMQDFGKKKSYSTSTGIPPRKDIVMEIIFHRWRLIDLISRPPPK
jgi:hypothetical protein